MRGDDVEASNRQKAVRLRTHLRLRLRGVLDDDAFGRVLGVGVGEKGGEQEGGEEEKAAEL